MQLMNPDKKLTKADLEAVFLVNPRGRKVDVQAHTVPKLLTQGFRLWKEEDEVVAKQAESEKGEERPKYNFKKK